MAHPPADRAQSSARSHPASSSSSRSSASTSMDYINAQLQAHGLARRPLSVSSLSSFDQEQLSKCLSALLQQRTDDLSSLEAVNTAHRTMCYDYERLVKMHNQAKEDSASAERKEQAARSQLTAAHDALKREQESHRKTKEEFAKARTALTFVRTQALHDKKKSESETARTLERWQKLSNDQARQQSSRSGLTVINLVESRGLALLRPLPEPSRFAQAAMDELEDARSRVVEENDAFRRILLQLGQNLQAVCVALETNPDAEVPDTITPSSLFDSTSPLNASANPSMSLSPSTTSHASTARATILSLLSQLQARVRKIRAEAGHPTDDVLAGQVDEAREAAAQRTIRQLEDELGQLRAELEERQEFMDDFVKKSTLVQSTLESAQNSDDLEGEASALALQKEALEEERKRFTEAAVKLGQDRLEMEAERLQFLEERRSHEMASLIANLPPTPDHPSTAPIPSSSSLSPSSAPSPPVPSSPARTHLTPSRRTFNRRSSPLAGPALVPSSSSSTKPAGGPPLASRAFLAGLGKENIGTPRKAAFASSGSRPSLLGSSAGPARRSRLSVAAAGSTGGGSPGKQRLSGRASLSVRG